MKTGAIIAIVAGVVVLLFWAVSKGLISSGVAVAPGGRASGIIAPQPSQNYSGFLAASTAGGVSSVLNTALSGLNNAFSTWMGSSSPAPATRQGASPSSPSLAAQPSGPSPNAFYSDTFSNMPTPVGPQVDASVSYNTTPGSAFDYYGLSTDNSYDASASLEL